MINVILIDEKIENSIPNNEYVYLRLLEFHKKFWDKVWIIRNKIGIPVQNENGIIGWKNKAPNIKLLHEEVLQLVKDPQMNIEPLFWGAIMDIIQHGIVCRALQPIQVFQKQGLNKSVESAAMPIIIIHKKLNREQLIKAIKKDWKQIETAMVEYEKTLAYSLQIKNLTIKEVKNNILIYREKQAGKTFPEIYDKHFRNNGLYPSESSMSRKHKTFLEKLRKIYPIEI